MPERYRQNKQSGLLLPIALTKSLPRFQTRRDGEKIPPILPTWKP